ncbi:FecR protein [Mucilaginibacter gossypiicola]|uniref:FecR protein n=1 Tax=Mucilaginibacter gossypiicola TaxID=551995 RepID=A0A1H7ZU47_9SPHI|nr:FecR domain-containing protein [Mucilaginibacter gossypiicola]SEM61955.1 FecR protein [Mucilaginibacter gossypiicola]
MDKEKAQALLNKYIAGNCTPEERLLVESWYNQLSEEAEPFTDKPEWDYAGKQIYRRLGFTRKLRFGRSWLYYSAAAILLLALSFGAYFYIEKRTSAVQYANDIAPGKSRATLTLANGEKINLDNLKSGELIRESHTRITKTSGGQLVYTALADEGDSNINAFNTIETPKGGQYQINLPDGTRVWLNAASSLKYPVVFSSTQRKVQLKGEAYFEVTHNQRKPFIVATDLQQVEVLGTHFNINAYNDEAAINTTLLEGRVKVSAKDLNAVLNPGQQSILTTKTHQLKVQAADLESNMAWKNGDFVFKNQDLESIMREVARWYNVEVVYAPNAPRDMVFGGWVSRAKNISAVLKIMELTGKVHFKVSGRRITVME